MNNNYPLLNNIYYNAFKTLNITGNLIIAGPCAVEDYDRLLECVLFLKTLGINYLRAGAFKPRTSIHDFQGLGEKGLDILRKIKEETGIKIVTEICDASYLEKYDFVDIIQIGTRNMQNFSLLQAIGRTKKPVILKRGFGNTLDEWLCAAEYIAKEGNSNIILCERGIKTFENSTRNTLDLASVAIIKQYFHLPIIVDPSHAAGRADIIPALSKASMSAGADGLLIEIHQNPENALSDKNQALDFPTFSSLIKDLQSQLGKN